MIAALRRRGTLLANLAVLVVLVVGIYHVGVNILRLQIGRDPITVSMQLTEAGGLFPRSEVTYRGKLVGTVTDIRLRPGGVVADLRLDEGTNVPVDTDAAVASLSAAGEQFVDLRPRTADGPFLRDGDVIPVERTTTPIATAVVLRDVARLLDQVNSEDLNVVVDELAIALEGTGPQLAQLVEDAGALVDSLQDALPETVDLLGNARTNLATANELSGDFDRFTGALRRLTRELRQSDPDIRRLLETGPPALADLDSFVTTLTTPISALLGNLITPGNLITARLPALEALLIAFPRTTAALRTTVRDGQFRVALHLTDNPVCGYAGPRQTPIDPTRTPPELDRTCRSEAPGVQARGAQNAPRSQPSGPGAPAVTAPARVAVGGYDPASGVVVLPDGERLALGPVRSGGSLSAALSLLMALLRS